jgi:formylglycine-generating enzyme required for sulfatase activity
MSGIILANGGAAIRLPTENEWYKSAYYNGASSTYSLYPNGQNSITTAEANYAGSASTDVGSYQSGNFYGTFDQGGNVWEWNDAVIAPEGRGLRGGSWDYWSGGFSTEEDLRSTNRGLNIGNTDSAGYYAGFRLVTIPEPTTLLLSILAGGVMLIRRKR